VFPKDFEGESPKLKLSLLWPLQPLLSVLVLLPLLPLLMSLSALMLLMLQLFLPLLQKSIVISRKGIPKSLISKVLRILQKSLCQKFLF
jgi:hypothetical protein